MPLAFGLPCALAFQVLRNFVTALGRPRPALYIMAATVLINCLGDYTLIFGHFGAPRLGLIGSGIASACSLAFSLLAIAAIIAVTPQLRAYRLLRRRHRPHWDTLREIVRLGGSMSAIQILELGFYLLMDLIVGSFGTSAGCERPRARRRWSGTLVRLHCGRDRWRDRWIRDDVPRL